MDSTLRVKLMLNGDCQLIALDKSHYREAFLDPSAHTILEFLKDSESVIVMQRLHQITGFEDSKLYTSDPIDLQTDGTFTYYRMIVPAFEHYLHEGVYTVANKYFSFENEIYYSEEDLEEFDLERVRLVEDYQEVWDARESDNQMYWFSDKFFSICKFNRCLTNLIKTSINKTVANGCRFGCAENNSEQANIDFLLETSFALSFLIETGRFEDAQRVLNSISECGNICSQEINNNTDCGCGKVKN